jgi:serine/threonine-protein kinase
MFSRFFRQRIEETTADSLRESLYDRATPASGAASDSYRGGFSPSSGLIARGAESHLGQTVCLQSGLTVSSSITVPELEIQSLAGAETPWRDPSAWSGKLLEGRYKIKGLLAHGGTSLVFRGVDQERKQKVALKVIPPGLSAIVAKSRSLTCSLEHPAVLQVLSTGPAGEGGMFQVLPLLEGLPFARLLDGRAGARAPLAALLLAFRGACEGVAHAHAHSVIHRDLKPSNIHVEPDARAVVADWDLACAAASGGKLRLGTPLYMAPEQFRGEPLGPPADIYALGLILYQVLTGLHPAGDGHDVRQIAYLAVNETPPTPTLLNPSVSPALAEVTLRCLLKDPAERYATAADLLEALEEAIF